MAAATLLFLGGCAKYNTDCELVVRPRVRPVQNSPQGGEAAYMVRVYTYYVSESDKDGWAPQSYADADAGIVRNLDTGEVRGHDLMGEQGDDTYIHITLSSSPVLLVAVDPIDRFYAWRVFEYEVPQIDPVTMVLRFQLWETRVQFTDSHWTMVNANLQEGGAGAAERYNTETER